MIPKVIVYTQYEVLLKDLLLHWYSLTSFRDLLLSNDLITQIYMRLSLPGNGYV